MRDRRTLTLTLSLSLALPVVALAAAGCSVNPLDPMDNAPAPDCSGLGIPAIACAVGETVAVCTLDSTGRARWTITCPGQQDGGVMTGAAGAGGGGGGGTGGAAGGGGAGGHTPCASTASCGKDEVCTTEDGVCKAPPGCGTGVACPAVCYGECRSPNEGPNCGPSKCAVGMVCCNQSCGVCTPPNGGCTTQVCSPPETGGACSRDDDCHLEADYCTGCDCRALAKGETVPRCPGPGVACLVDPCGRQTARCVNGKCAAQ